MVFDPLVQLVELHEIAVRRGIAAHSPVARVAIGLDERVSAVGGLARRRRSRFTRVKVCRCRSRLRDPRSTRARCRLKMSERRSVSVVFLRDMSVPSLPPRIPRGRIGNAHRDR